MTESTHKCAKCGETVTRNGFGWSHRILRPMSVTEYRRKFRHVVKAVQR